MKLHHIGIIVSSIEEESAIYGFLGYQKDGSITEDTVQNNRILFLWHPDSKECIELIEPMNQQSSVINLPKGLAHLCYQVDNLDTAIAHIHNNKIGKVFTQKLCAPAIGNSEIVFVYFKNKSIIELVELTK